MEPIHRPRRSCSTCRTPIAPDTTYWRCSVATCNSGRTKLRFCSPKCFEVHVPTARHRSARPIAETSGTTGPSVATEVPAAQR